MRYFTKEQYLYFYGQPGSLRFDRERFAQLSSWYDAAFEWQDAEFEKMPPDTKFRDLDFHDCFVMQMELKDRILKMQIDASQGFIKASQIVFYGVELISDRLPECPENGLDWFNCETAYIDGRYRIGILFREWKESVELTILEFTADDVDWE